MKHDDDSAKFVEDRLGPNHRGLITLRNLIDHGAPINQPDLRLSDVMFFRKAACEYLEQVYGSFGDPKPAWLGAA